MLPTFALAVTLGSSLPPAQSAAKPEAAQEFRTTLAQAQELVQRGGFERADQLLKSLLERHADTVYARQRQLEIVELAHRCAFQRSNSMPKLAELVTGELVRWDAKGGDLEIRYANDHMGDFEKAPFGKGGAMLLHPAVFVDTFTLEIEFGPKVVTGPKGPRVLVGMGTDEEFLVCFGEADPGQNSYETTYTPPQLLRVKDDDTDVVDSHEKPAPAYNKKGSLKVVVGSGGVTAYRDGKRILQGKRSTRESGQIAIIDISGFERVTLKGKIQASWPQGLLDAATQAALTKFDTTWKPQSELPAWLFAPVAAAHATKPGSIAGSEEFESRCAELEESAEDGSLAEYEEGWRKLAAEFPNQPEAWRNLAIYELLLGRLDAAQSTCDAAIAAGIPSAALDELPSMVVKARAGPEWKRVFSHESTNYVVKSDIDQETCVAASKVLEESYRSYRQRLSPVAGIEKRKFTVFLFSGKAGYLDYAKNTLRDTPASTAGLYSSLLKQLLIWNVPDRADMFLTIRHEGFHQYLDRLTDDPPIWFNEGMAEYYELADLYGGEWKEGQRNADHVARIRDSIETWVPLETLLDMDPETFQGKDVHWHYAESWAVVHYLRQGPKSAKELFQQFWNALIAGKSSEDATEEVFGAVDLDVLDQAIRDYVLKL